MVKTSEKFNGEINGVKIYDFISQIDNSLTQQERLDKLYAMLYDEEGNLNEFFETLFSTETDNKDWFNVCLKQSDFTSDKNNVCKVLEMLGSWLIFSPDGERITKKTKYNFYSKDTLEKKEQREVSFSVFQSEEVDDQIYDEIIDFVVDPSQNYRAQPETKILAQDIRDIQPIADYQKLINHVKALGVEKYGSVKKNNFICYELQNDQKWLKDYLCGTIVFKHPTKDSCEPEYDNFDFFEKEHIQLLLKCNDKDFQFDTGCLLHDLDVLAMGASLTKPEKIVYYHLRHNSKSLGSIADYMNCTKQFVSTTYNNIIKKIIKRYEVVYEDWYYMNICRGKYKKCNKCGKIKLLTTNYFGKDASKNDGFKYNCKQCDEKM